MENQYDIPSSALSFELDESVYPRAVSVAAAYRFLDRCYVRLARAGKAKLSVRLKGKRKTPRAALEALAGEFHNELLHQLIRHLVSERTSGLRDAIVGRALFSAEPPSTALEVDAAGPEAKSDLDYLDDPLGIAVPWEEKYGDGQEEGDGGKGKGQGG